MSDKAQDEPPKRELLLALESLVGCVQRWPNKGKHGEWKRPGWYIELDDAGAVALSELIRRHNGLPPSNPDIVKMVSGCPHCRYK